MKKIILLFFVLSTFSIVSQAQVAAPKLRKFNVGLFMGIGGQAGPPINLIPVLNLSYKGTSLTAGVAMNSSITVGLIQDIMPISVAYNHVRWIGSTFYSQGVSDRYYSKDSDYKNISVLTGLRFNFGKKFYSNTQLGASYTTYSTPGYEDIYEWLPAVEFGIGYNIFKTFDLVKKPTTKVAE